MSIAGVTRELLVRYLETWAPAVLSGSRRATFALSWSGPADIDTAEATLRVFAEFADLLGKRRLSIVVTAPETAELSDRLRRVVAELGLPPALSVNAVAGHADALLPVALTAARAAGAPVLAYLETAGEPPIATVAAGKPAELLLATGAGGWPDCRENLRAAGFPVTAAVELVDGVDTRLLAFATTALKHLEAFKNAMWAVDEYAGVRYRDPHDPDGHEMDISLNPHPGPLRRELLEYLASGTERSISELRHFTLTETVYRTSDATRVLTALLTAGTLTRTPERGRLSGDVMVRLAKPGDSVG
jgi:hypothetical protein